MRLALSLAVSLPLVCPSAAVAQAVSHVDARMNMEELQATHIHANLPDEKSFFRLLQHDLDAYFAANGSQALTVRFELLRRAATQSGVAYPKFYLWVHVRCADGRFTSGALRAAFVEQRRFNVTDFLSATEIRADPSRVGYVFPAPLVPAIIERAAGR